MTQHLRRLQKKYARLAALFQSEIASAFPEGTRTSNPRGGHFIWVSLPEGSDSLALTEKSIQQGISLAPGILFSSRQNYRNYFRINCAIPWSIQVTQAIQTIGHLALMMTR
jgi:DNA-binding transcriptional MocR family regulator